MKRLLAAFAGILLFNSQTNAAPITYTVEATGSGSLGGNAFINSLITIQFTGDTSNVSGGGGFFTNSVGTTTVTIAGLGTFTFTGPTQAFVNQTFGPAAAGIGVPGLGSILDTFNEAVFSTYALDTSIGPVSGPSFIRPDLNYATTGGLLNISSAGDSTFTASTNVIPEPATLAVFGLGMLAMGGYSARRIRKS